MAQKTKKLSDEDKLDMLKMRFYGHTLDEIAEKHGVTKQYVSFFFDRVLKQKKFSKTLSNIIYPNLAECMRRNYVTILDLATSIDCYYNALQSSLKGERPLSEDIKEAISNLFGVSKEILFKTI